MCYAAVNKDDEKGLGRQKERKKSSSWFRFVSFPFLSYLLFSLYYLINIASLLKNPLFITEFFNCLQSNGVAVRGRGSGASATWAAQKI